MSVGYVTHIQWVDMRTDPKRRECSEVMENYYGQFSEILESLGLAARDGRSLANA